ncbi:MAG: PD-(D/E)XK nuclease family protein [Methanophagales archaeon]|nr:PD-(D/E)XK nuclease family protein [Methanophagales archaeon]
MNNKPEKEILEEFIHENAELEQLEEIVDEFNIFNALDIVNKEVRHSNFLSWLMNPNESHGLGDYFLTSFLKKVSSKASSLGIEGPSVFDIDSWNFDDGEILREWKNIDILIKCDNQKFICVVENKIYSKEHSEQLQRYKDIIKKEYPDYKKFFVYLTIEGDIPSDNEYLPLSYSDVAPLIEHLIKSKKNKLSSEILSFISHYKDMLRRYVMKDSEIQEICRKIYKRHKKALDLIFEYKPDKLLEIHDCLVEIIPKDPNLILDESSKSYIHFIPKNLDFIPKKGDGWTKTKRILLFELNNNPNGVDLYLIIGPGPQDIREKLYDIAKRNLSLFNKSKRNLTKQWFTLYKKSILKSKEYENKEAEEMKKLIEEKLTKFKTSDLPKIEDEIKKFNEHSV